MMLEQMTAAEWNEVQTYNLIEPFGEYREELRHGQKMAQYANYHPSKDQTEAFKPIDFMNFTEAPKEKILTPEEIEQALTGIFGA